jgi:hypothetical protein
MTSDLIARFERVEKILAKLIAAMDRGDMRLGQLEQVVSTIPVAGRGS